MVAVLLKNREKAVLAFAMLFPFVLTLLYFVVLARSDPFFQKTTFGLGKTLQFLIPIVWVGLVLREKWVIRSFHIRGVLEGIGFGAVVFLAILGAYHFFLRLPEGPLAPDSLAAQEIIGKVESFGVRSTAMFLLFGGFYSLIHSGLEEYYWRWFVFGRLKNNLRPTRYAAGKAILLSSLAFALHHYLLLGTYFGYASPLAWFGTLGVAIGGAYWAWSYERFDSIWPAWVSHGVIDAAIFLVGFSVKG